MKTQSVLMYYFLNVFFFSYTLIVFSMTSMAQVQAVTAPNLSTSSLLPIKDPSALVGNELSRLDNLIQATQKSLEGQKQLRERIVEYQKIQESYSLHPKDNEILFRMIKSAYGTLHTIQENHLEHAFDPEFISELKVLAQVASKRGVPKP